MGTDSPRIGPTRAAKKLDMQGSLTELASDLAFYYLS